MFAPSNHLFSSSSSFFFLFFLLLVFPLQVFSSTDNCYFYKDGGSEREGDSVVCLCTSNHCPPLFPSIPPSPPSRHRALSYTTSKGGLRFKEEEITVLTDRFGDDDGKRRDGSVVVELALNSPKQFMEGFGGSVTDSSAIIMNHLSPPTMEALLRDYFSPQGLQYSLLRVPIAGSDFSSRPYTYLDDHPGDVELTNFKLAEEDLKYKLPLLHRIFKMAAPSAPPRVLASPWSAPPWMKTNAKINETGQLLNDMYQPYANYLVKFIKEYEEADVPIWAITSQNHAFTQATIPFNSMSWTPGTMGTFIRDHLGPSLQQADLSRVKIYVGDDTRDKTEMTRQLFQDPEISHFISGVAVHWYHDFRDPPTHLSHAHLLHPDKQILYTEACIAPEMKGVRDLSKAPVIMGSWRRAEMYAENIIETVNNYVSAWIDWNLCLDTTGGPNWAGNEVDAPIIVDEAGDKYYRQPMFYAMGHFSKFVPRGSQFVPSWVWVDRGTTVDQRKEVEKVIHTAAFIHPAGHVVLQLLNKGESQVEVRVEWEGGSYLNTPVPPKSLQTLLLPWDGGLGHGKDKYRTQGHD